MRLSRQVSVWVTLLVLQGWLSAPRALAGGFVVRGEHGGRYQASHLLGKGANGEVWAGHELDGLRREVAIKTENVAGAFGETEASLLRRFGGHGGVPELVDTGAVEGAEHGTRALLMEMVKGKALGDSQSVFEPLPPGPAVRTMIKVLEQLRPIHAEGFRHADVHPGNVMRDGKSATTRLVDVGLMQPIDGPVSLGSNPFAPPYNWWVANNKNPIGPDLYAVGRLLLSAISGRIPHRADTTLLTDITASDGNGTRSLQDVVERATNEDPEKCFQSAQEFIDALTPFANSLP